jgi:hypothetical protein
VFNANAHQPGAQRVMGKIYDASDVTQGEAVLADLARHPSTAKFIAENSRGTSWPTIRRRHWWRGSPMSLREPTATSRRWRWRWRISDDAWKAPLAKMRSPYEFLVASGPLARRRSRKIPAAISGALNSLGQPLWAPAGPNGFPDSNAAWAAPEGIKLRLDISAQIASRLGRRRRSARPARTRCRGCGVVRGRGGPSSARNRGSRRWRCC